MGVLSFLQSPFGAAGLPKLGKAPELRGLTWLQGADGEAAEPVTLEQLRGKPVLVNFWTYSCINCVRTLPVLKDWHRRYAAHGLTIIGVHAPEFAFEHDRDNVRRAVERFGIPYRVALDNDFATWKSYDNRYWPAYYFIDAQGNIRSHHFGEGAYAEGEAVIRTLLAETGVQLDEAVAESPAAGVTEPPKTTGVTEETYLGFERSDFLGSPETLQRNVATRFTSPREFAPNKYYLKGVWEVRDGYAMAMEKGTSLIYRVTARSVHAVMETSLPEGCRVRVTLDGNPIPVANRGRDIAEDSTFTVHEGRVYDLYDSFSPAAEHLLQFEFLHQGVRCYSITFG